MSCGQSRVSGRKQDGTMTNYGVDAEQITKFDERWYRRVLDKKKGTYEVVPGVTTYLEAYPKGVGYDLWLMNTKDPYAMRDEAGQLGTETHKLIELTLHGEMAEYFDGQTKIEAWERYLSWCLWWKTFTKENVVKYEKEWIEHLTWNDIDKYAGTVDLIAEVNGKIEIFDWKTGSFVGDTAEIQVSAYAESVGLELNKQILIANIVQLNPKLNKKGVRVREINRDEILSNFEDFKHIQKIWHRENKNAKPKFLTYPTKVNLKYIEENEIIIINKNIGE
jgi:hypothetical protein